MCVTRAYVSMCHDERKKIQGEKGRFFFFICSRIKKGENRGQRMSQEGERLLFFTFFFCGCFFRGGEGGEEEGRGHVLLSRFRRTTRVFEQPLLCYILYIDQWGFHCNMCQTITDSVPDPRYPGPTCVTFKFPQVDDLFHGLKNVRDSWTSFHPRTPRNSGYGVLWTSGLCYMLFLLYV
jgi:hypothetical protein